MLDSWHSQWSEAVLARLGFGPPETEVMDFEPYDSSNAKIGRY